jgi:hypothetical protein
VLAAAYGDGAIKNGQRLERVGKRGQLVEFVGILRCAQDDRKGLLLVRWLDAASTARAYYWLAGLMRL